MPRQACTVRGVSKPAAASRSAQENKTCYEGNPRFRIPPNGRVVDSTVRDPHSSTTHHRLEQPATRSTLDYGFPVSGLRDVVPVSSRGCSPELCGANRRNRESDGRRAVPTENIFSPLRSTFHKTSAIWQFHELVNPLDFSDILKARTSVSPVATVATGASEI